MIKSIPKVGRLAESAPLLVIALLAVDGLHFVFARALHDYLPPITSVLYVLGIATVLVTIFAAYRGRLRWDTFRRHAGFFLAIGAVVAISTTVNYTAVAYVDPGAASLLSQTSILFGLAFGLIWLKERLVRAQWLGAAVALMGVGIVTFQPGDYFRFGSLLILGSSILYAFHAALVKRYGGEIDLLEFFLWRLASTSGFLLLAAIAQGALVWPSGRAWLLLLLTGLVDVVISRTLYYAALRRLNISIHSLVLTLSPVVAVAWSVALSMSQLTAQGVLGGLVTVIGIALVTSQRE
jgi:drug/metabolite transporter (DMT)-like permease